MPIEHLPMPNRRFTLESPFSSGVLNHPVSYGLQNGSDSRFQHPPGATLLCHSGVDLNHAVAYANYIDTNDGGRTVAEPVLI